MHGRRGDDQQIAARTRSVCCDARTLARCSGLPRHGCSGREMQRREFIARGAGAAAWLLPWARPARAQTAAQADQAAADQVGQVATVQGSATVMRAKSAPAIALRVNDPVFKDDMLTTGPNSSLGITFDDETTFSLSANTRIVVNKFIYQEGGNANAASFHVAIGTASFVASLVAKTGDMQITTPVATLGIRGTTGVVDVPAGGTAGGADEPRIKLYPDANGYVGRIEVFNPQGERIGALTQGASALALRAGAGGRLEAVSFQISAQEAARDRRLLQRLRASHNIGRRMISKRRSRHGQPGRSHAPHERNRRGRKSRRPGEKEQR